MNQSDQAVKVNRIQLRAKRTGSGKTVLVGILLAAAGIAAGWYFLFGGQGTHRYWVAKLDLPAGAALSSDVLTAKSYELGDSGSSYLESTDSVQDFVLTEPLAKGQLVGASQVSESATKDMVSVVLQPSTMLASRVRAGSVVKVWTTPKDASGQFELPELLIEVAQVFSVVKPDGVFKAAVPQVELMVPEQSVPALLAAIAAEDAITLIPRTDLGKQ